MNIIGKGNFIFENPVTSGSGANYVYVCQVDGKISSEAPIMNGMGKIDKEEEWQK